MNAVLRVVAHATVMVVLLGVVPASVLADFVQHPVDSGAVDTIAIEFSQVPNAAAGQLSARLDLYAFTDGNHVSGLPFGFAWDNPNAILDSAVIAPALIEGFDIFTMTYMQNDLAISNRYNVFCLVAIGGYLPNWPAAPQRRLLASYFLTMQQWSAGDSLVVDTSSFTMGSQYVFFGRLASSWIPYFAGPAVAYDASVCCVGMLGNIDCDPDDLVTMGDLSALTDHLFVSYAPLCCPEEGDLDNSGSVDNGDLTALIDHLFISYTPLPACP